MRHHFEVKIKDPNRRGSGRMLGSGRNMADVRKRGPKSTLNAVLVPRLRGGGGKGGGNWPLGKGWTTKGVRGGGKRGGSRLRVLQ